MCIRDRRKSYRLRRERDAALIPLLAQCDPGYTHLSPARTIFQVYLKLDCFCTETVSYTHLDVYKRQAMRTLNRLKRVQTCSRTI